MKKMIIVSMKTVVAVFLLIVLSNQNVMSQGGTAINTTGNPADPAAILDVSASDKGVLVPRVALVSVVDPIAGSKPDGLLVWNTSVMGAYSVPGFYYWNGADWQMIAGTDNLGNHVATQDLDMNSNRITNLQDPSSSEDAVNAQTIQKGNLIFGLATGTDNYAVALNPPISMYNAGMVVNFLVANANTGSVTIDVNGLGATPVLKNGNLPLIASDIKSGQIVSVIYDGTNFQMVSQAGNVPTGGGGGSFDPTLIYTIDGF
jgi:hypothetical protein